MERRNFNGGGQPDRLGGPDMMIFLITLWRRWTGGGVPVHVHLKAWATDAVNTGAVTTNAAQTIATSSDVESTA